MNIEGMTLKQLGELRARIVDLLPAKEREEKVKLKERLAAIAAESGFSLDEIMAKTKKVGRKTPIARRPMKDAKTGAVYFGRGRPPRDFDMKRARPL